MRGVSAPLLLWSLFACSATICLLRGLRHSCTTTHKHKPTATNSDHTDTIPDGNSSLEEDHQEEEEEEGKELKDDTVEEENCEGNNVAEEDKELEEEVVVEEDDEEEEEEEEKGEVSEEDDMEMLRKRNIKIGRASCRERV